MLFRYQKARRYRRLLAWGIWVVASIFVLFHFCLQLSAGEMLQALAHSFSLTAFGAGALAAGYYYIYVLLQTPAGMLMDRYGARGILTLGACAVALGCCLFGSAEWVVWAFLGRILMGAGAAFAFVGCLNLISAWFPKRKFTLMVSFVEAGGMLGTIVGNYGLAYLIGDMGWRRPILYAAIFSCILAASLWLIVRDVTFRKRIRQKKKQPEKQQSIGFYSLGIKTLITKPVLWVNGIYSGAMFSLLTVFAALWAIPFVELVHHVPLIIASLVVSVLYLGVAVGGPILGWVDGRTVHRREMMILTALLATILSLLCIYWVDAPLIMLAVLFFLLGMCTSSYMLTFSVSNQLTSQGNRATGLGFTNTICVLFAPILQPLIGFLIVCFDGGKSVSGSITHSIPHFQWALTVLPVLLVVAAICAIYLPSSR